MIKRAHLLLLTLLLTFGITVLFSAQAQAADTLKLNSKKLVLEMNTTFPLRVMGIDEEEDPYTGVEESEAGDEEATEEYSVSWTSSNKKVVTVSEEGELTPVSVGTAKVTASVEGKRYVCNVTVVDYSGMSIEQKDVVSYALKYVGNKYRYGGISLTKGTDCSGFTLSIYKKFGYRLSHNAYRQMYETTRVKAKDIQPGDLVFYGNSKRTCGHVGIYIGSGKVIHASNPTNGIIISNYNYRKYVAVGRLLETETYPDEENEELQNDNVTRMAVSR